MMYERENQISDGKSVVVYHTILLLVFIPFVFYWLGLHDLFSSPLSMSISAVLLTVCLLRCMALSMGGFVILCFSLCFLFANAMTYQNLGVVVAFYNLIVCLILFNSIQFKPGQVQRIRLLVMILLGSFLLSLNYDFQYDIVQVSGKHAPINSNSLGILVLAWYYHACSFIEQGIQRRWLRRLLHLVSVVVALYWIQISACRSALFAFILFFVLCLFKRWKLQNYKKLYTIAVVISLIFPFIYLLMSDAMQGVTILGKSFDTRSIVWESTLELIKQHPILGSGTDVSIKNVGLGAVTDSAHNVFLGFWKTIGLVPCFAYVFYLLQGSNISYVSKSNILSKKMFLSCMLICSVETLLNDSNTYLFYVLLLLTICEHEPEVEQYDP